MQLRFTTPDAPELSPTELALYGKMDPVRMMVNASIRRFVNEHSELLAGRVLDYGAGKIGTCRTPQPFRYMLPAHDYVPWEPGDVIPARDGSFEGILCTQVIQNVDDPPLLFREFLEWLSPGGHLVLTYPIAWQQIEQELWRFTERGIWAMCHRRGLKIVQNRVLCQVELDGIMPMALVGGLVARKV